MQGAAEKGKVFEKIRLTTFPVTLLATAFDDAVSQSEYARDVAHGIEVVVADVSGMNKLMDGPINLC